MEEQIDMQENDDKNAVMIESCVNFRWLKCP